MLFVYHNMRLSSKRTTLSVLRALLGLSVEELANLIDKSVPTIRSLESGRLKLGEETARRIAKETGVSIYWLLAADPSKEPFSEDDLGVRWPYSKEIFELIQVQGDKSPFTQPEITPAVLHAATVRHCLDWLPIFASAQKAGKGDLAVFSLRRFFAEMGERFGADHKVAREASRDSRLITPDGEKYAFLYRDPPLSERPDALLLSMPKRARRKTKKLPSQPSPANAHHASGRTSS
jgi:transcriptional regulator with XRE-family HTH domain